MKQLLLSAISALFVFPQTTHAGGLQAPGLVTPQFFCDQLEDMAFMPLKGGVTSDPVYNGLIASGAGAVPCLIAEIENTRPVKAGSPLNAPGFHHLKVGDLALLMIERLVRVPMNEILPSEVAKDFEDRGYPAYLESSDKVRSGTAKSLRAWFDKNRGDLVDGRSIGAAQCLTNIKVTGTMCYLDGMGM